jgi:hypothetical protein
VRSAVRPPDGRIAVSDGGTSQVRIYGPDGRHLVSAGGPRSGPGGVRLNADLIPDRMRAQVPPELAAKLADVRTLLHAEYFLAYAGFSVDPSGHVWVIPYRGPFAETDVPLTRKSSTPTASDWARSPHLMGFGSWRSGRITSSAYGRMTSTSSTCTCTS